MNPFKFLKNEKAIIFEERMRQERENEARAAYEEQEMQRVREEAWDKINREQGAHKEDFVDNIEFLHDMREKVKDKINQTKVDAIVKEREHELEKERRRLHAQQKQRINAHYWKKAGIILAIVATCIIVVCGTIGITMCVIVARDKDKYQEAITDISNHEYLEAKKLLDGVWYEDGESIYSYLELMCDVEKYKGNANDFFKKYSAISTKIRNPKVKSQYTANQNDLLDVIYLDNNIDTLYQNFKQLKRDVNGNNDEMLQLYKSQAAKLKSKADELNKEFLPLIDMSKLEEILSQ